MPAALGALALGLLLSAWPGEALAGFKITVKGISGEERDNVEARLSILTYVDEEDGEDLAQIRRLHRQAPDEIRRSLQAYGYYEPVIQAKLEGDPPVSATYDIDPGPPTLLGDVAVTLSGEGAQAEELTAVIARSKLKSGERLRHADYDTTKADLARAAYQGGFLDARFTAHVLEVDAMRRRADITLSLDTGPRYYFGEVSVAQQGLDPGFIARYVPIVPGDPFNPEKLLQAQFVLSDLGYFASVDVQPQRDKTVDQRIPIVIATTPRPPSRYDIGVGYGTDTGARVPVTAEFRKLNDTGHKLKLSGLASEVKNSGGLDYRIPLGTRAGENLGFATTYTLEHIGDGSSRRYEFTISLSRTPGKWQRQIYLRHTYEKSFEPATGEDSTKLLLPGVSFSRTAIDDPIHARKGWSVFLDVHGGHEAVVSDVSFLEARGLLRGAYPLGERARVLGRVEYGAIVSDHFPELPVSQRFFAGGDQSVRGYAYQSLGRRDGNGLLVGGKYLSTYSLETEYRIQGNWGAAAFFDMGNADDDPAPSMKRGAGLGLRYRAPVGTVQVDLAYPLDGDHHLRPHLGIRVGL